MTEYEKHAHAVQSAIAAFGEDHPIMQPKHLRVGIDMSKADMKGLAELLMAKGVFTQEEYVAAITKSAEDEVTFQRHKLAAHMGVDPNQLSLL